MTDDPMATTEALRADAPEPAVQTGREGDIDKTASEPSPALREASTVPVPAATGKLADLLRLVSRKRGATLEELSRTMRWQPHTARAALSRLRKMGYKITREQIGTRMAYRMERR